MKKLKKLIAVLLIVASTFALQGCSYYEELTTPVTSHEVVMNETNSFAFHVNLKADLTQNYKWYVYSTADIDVADTTYREGVFNDTYTSEYKYITRNEGEFDLYLVLVQDANLETARIFPYEMEVTSDGVSFTEMSAYNLNTDKKLMKTLEGALTLE